MFGVKQSRLLIIERGLPANPKSAKVQIATVGGSYNSTHNSLIYHVCMLCREMRGRYLDTSIFCRQSEAEFHTDRA